MPFRSLHDPDDYWSRSHSIRLGGNGDPRLLIPMAIVFIIAGLLSTGLIHLSLAQKAKRAAANALPSTLTLIDEQGRRTVLPLDAPPPAVPWLSPPEPTETDYPVTALDAGVSGYAVIMCDAMQNGDVENCAAVEEWPSGYGFADAAINIISRGKLPPQTDPESAPRSFTFRVPFHLE